MLFILCRLWYDGGIPFGKAVSVMKSIGWQRLFEQEATRPYMRQLKRAVLDAYETKNVYPRYEDIYKALEATPFEEVKVVILGQDPYHGPGQADGLAFSVPNGTKVPPSLRNIFKELCTDLNVPAPSQTDLMLWAKQGVLLLNTCLTVFEGEPLSHAKFGWDIFTDKVLQRISSEKDGIVFILWGANAQKKLHFIDLNRHFVVQSAHPSPLSAHRGFFGSRPFSKTNDYLIKNGLMPIDWGLT